MSTAQQLARKRAGQVGAGQVAGGGGGNGIYNRGGGGGANGGGNGRRGNGGGKPKFSPWKVLNGLNTDGVLSGEELAAGARALTAIEQRPLLHGYKQLANQLAHQRESTDRGISGLATKLQGGVSDAYMNLAKSAAQDLTSQQTIAGNLNTAAGSIAQQAAQSLQGTQAGQLSDYTSALDLRGAPGGGSAQQELANITAEQKAAQATQSEQARQSANQQGAGFAQLQAMMAGAAQMEGGSAVAGIARAAQNRKTTSDEKYGQAVQEALGKWADAKATKGPSLVKNLLELRDKEQKFKLGEQAVAGEKGQLQLGHEELAEEKRKHNQDNKLGWAEHSTKQWEAEHPNASSSEKRKHRQKVKEEVGEVKSLIPSLVAAYGAPWKAEANGNAVPLPKAVNAFILALNEKASADPKLVQHVVKTWVKKHYKKASKDPNGPSLGR